MQTQSIVVLALIPLILWRMYSRVRRLVGRQKSVAWRHWTAALLFPVLLLALLASAIGRPMTEAALGGGVIVGVALAIYGLRLTRFERTPEGLFYTPNAHIGIGLSMLMAARILYRLFQTYEGALQGPAAAHEFSTSPLTLLVFGMLAGYYCSFAIGLLRWRKAQEAIAPLG
jgi:cytochrome b561